MRVALVHDWITGMRGGERCLEHFLGLYPEADIYTLLHVPGKTTPLIDSRVRGTSFLQNIPGIEYHYRKFLPLFPRAANSLVVEGYDLVISLSHAAAKNVKLKNVGKHVCYCFTPMRYIWDMAPVYFDSGLRAAWPLIWSLRRWDKLGAKQVDDFVVISKFVAARVRKFYGRSSRVIYPPVNSEWFEEGKTREKRGGGFLYAGAFVPYKGVELIIDVFNDIGLPLKCIGKGPLEGSLRHRAKSNIEFLGHLSDDELKKEYQRARALLFPAKEDFGIIPIEALAAGTPLIAGYHGALRETHSGLKWWLNEEFNPLKHTGVFFKPHSSKERRASNLKEAIEAFLQYEDSFINKTAQKQASKFSSERFTDEWRDFLNTRLSKEKIYA